MTSGKGIGSRRATAPRGRRPAGRLAAGILAATAAAAGCGEGARHAAHLTAEIERSYPGSRIAIEELVEDGARTVEVTILAAELPDDVAELGERARAVARSTREHFGLRPGRDRVVVVLGSEGGAGPVVRSRQRARFVYPVEEIGGG